VETENLVVDQCSEGEVVEEIGEIFPDVGIAVFPQALVVEAVDLGDLPGLMVSTKDGDPMGVSDFESDKEGHGLDGVVPSVYVVSCFYVQSEHIATSAQRTHKEVVGIRVRSTNAEQLHQIMELSVNVAADCDRAFLCHRQ
jgi:hypothetical protein